MTTVTVIIYLNGTKVPRYTKTMVLANKENHAEIVQYTQEVADIEWNERRAQPKISYEITEH